MRGLIITGGQLDDALTCDAIKNGGYEIILAADSGMELLYRHHLTPDIIVGDFDSVNTEALSYFRRQEQIEFCQLNPEKDDTDTEFAVRYAISLGVTELTILGAMGSRMDHVLANISLLGIGLENDIAMELLDRHNRIRMISAPMTIKKQEQYGDYISILPYSEKVTRLTLTGFKYNLSDYDMRGFNSLGISNEIVEDEAGITFEDGILLVIEARD